MISCSSSFKLFSSKELSSLNSSFKESIFKTESSFLNKPPLKFKIKGGILISHSNSIVSFLSNNFCGGCKLDISSKIILLSKDLSLCNYDLKKNDL